MRIARLVLVALAIVGVTAHTITPGQSGPIKVGTIFPAVRRRRTERPERDHAVQMMAEMHQCEGGVLGRKIAVISKDDESTPAVGVTRANELIAEKVA